jgi:hypothetical protein
MVYEKDSGQIQRGNYTDGVHMLPSASLFPGSGWVRTFTAAKIGGLKNYFVEQNWELTQQSVAFLKTLNV